jgi:hypothetical protein
MKTIKVTIPVFLFLLIVLKGFCQYDYATGKDYMIRSKIKGELTRVTRIRIDQDQTALVKISTDEGRVEDKVHFIVLAPSGEVFCSLTTRKDGIFLNISSPDSLNYYFIPYDKLAYEIKRGICLEGEEIRNQLKNNQLAITENKVDATRLNLTFNPAGEVITAFARRGDMIEFKGAGILVKAKNVVFD